MTAPVHLWFLNSWVSVRLPAADGTDGISILDHHVPSGDSPPLHVHRTEDEVFHILEGEYRVKLGDGEIRAGAGDILLAPKGTPHTYRCESAQGGRFLTITTHGDFERFVRALGRPAARPERPPAQPPTPEVIQTLTEVAALHGIDILGPPLV